MKSGAIAFSFSLDFCNIVDDARLIFTSAFDLDDLYAFFILVENYNNWTLVLTCNAFPKFLCNRSDQGVPIVILEFLIPQCQSLSTNMQLRPG